MHIFITGKNFHSLAGEYTKATPSSEFRELPVWVADSDVALCGATPTIASKPVSISPMRLCPVPACSGHRKIEGWAGTHRQLHAGCRHALNPTSRLALPHSFNE